MKFSIPRCPNQEAIGRPQLTARKKGVLSGSEFFGILSIESKSKVMYIIFLIAAFFQVGPHQLVLITGRRPQYSVGCLFYPGIRSLLSRVGLADFYRSFQC